MDTQNQYQNQQQHQQLYNQQPSITFSSVVSALFYLLTIAAVSYYLWTWWQNTTRLKKSLAVISDNHAIKIKEGFIADESTTLSLEKPAATQAKIQCTDSPYKLPTAASNTTGVWDGEEDGHILFEEPPRRWTDTRLGSDRYSSAVNQALDGLKKKYEELITETTGQMLNALSDAGLNNYLPIFIDLDKLVSANSQIAQLKGIMLSQTEQLTRISRSLVEIQVIKNDPASAYSKKWQTTTDDNMAYAANTYKPVWEQSGMSREELGRQIIRNRQMREYLEQITTDDDLLSTSTANMDVYDYITQNPNILSKLVKICDKLITSYKVLLPLVDEVISERAKYEKEIQEIRDLVDVLPDQATTENSADAANGKTGGRGHVPEGVLGSDSTNRSPTSDRWPQRYYLNARSTKNFKVTKDLDMLRTKLKDPQGFSKEEYEAKYNWVDRVGKDVLPVEGDAEIKYSLPAGMQRTIPDIISDFDHNNANCQRIYGECSTRTNVPGFPLPNWDTADYYNYLARLPDAKQAAEGKIPMIN
jgi:hypothetical protein